jgi:hypothetical protein
MKNMKAEITADKKEIIEWVSTLEDKNLIDKITQLMKESKPKQYFTEAEARKISKEKIAQWFGK